MSKEMKNVVKHQIVNQCTGRYKSSGSRPYQNYSLSFNVHEQIYEILLF